MITYDIKVGIHTHTYTIHSMYSEYAHMYVLIIVFSTPICHICDRLCHYLDLELTKTIFVMTHEMTHGDWRWFWSIIPG